MRTTSFLPAAALVAAMLLSGCNENQTAQDGTKNSSGGAAATFTLPSGTAIEVTLASTISSKDAGVGDAWGGSVRTAAFHDGRNVIPAGSSVSGIVKSVRPAVKGDRAMLDLELTSITVDGHSYPVRGVTESVVAGSTRARNLGAIAGSAAAGALIGNAASGTTKGTVVGAVVGGGVATGVVAASDGYQVVLKPGIATTFTTSDALAVRL